MIHILKGTDIIPINFKIYGITICYIQKNIKDNAAKKIWIRFIYKQKITVYDTTQGTWIALRSVAQWMLENKVDFYYFHVV